MRAYIIRGEPVDYYAIDTLLTEEEKRFRGRVSKFVDEECLPSSQITSTKESFRCT